jgi:type I restriction enzyme S subunit
VNGGIFRPEENKRLPDELVPQEHYEVVDGDILMSRANTRTLVGSVGRLRRPPGRLLLCDKLYRLTPDTQVVDGDYLALALASPQAREWIEAEATGTSQSMVNIGQDVVRDLKIPVPSLDKQRETVASLREEWATGDQLSGSLDRQLELLGEHRRAVIVAATTGRLDIVEERVAA